MNHFLRTNLIKNAALKLGFSACGIAKAENLVQYAEWLNDSLNRGYNGKMIYLKRNLNKRLNPETVLQGAKSVISLLLSYYTPEEQSSGSFYKISKYALGKDYHIVLREKLQKLSEFIIGLMPDVKISFFVDAPPVLEKALAMKAGLGFIGKNSLLINENFGTYSFICEIFIDKELSYDKPFIRDLCGDCKKCIDACPAKALVKPNVLDARKCISYNNIESRFLQLNDLNSRLSGWIYGCDICQQVCPWNKNLKTSSEPDFMPKPEILRMTKDDWNKLNEEKFNSLFCESAVKRIKFDGLMRNINTNKTLPLN